MRTNRVRIRWVPGKDMFHMKNLDTGRQIQELYDCQNMHDFFEGLDKTVDCKYTVSITKEDGMEESRTQDWYVEVTLTVIGPKEKPVILSGRYLGTNREVAETLQNKFGQQIEELNKMKK